MELLPAPCLVVLVGPSGAGKSTWATQQFPAGQIVESDRLRALVGHGEDDLDATADAFALLDTIVERRLARRLTTVVDTLGLDPRRRLAYREAAARAGVPCVAVAFDVPTRELEARNRGRGPNGGVPAAVLTQQVRSWRRERDALSGEGFTAVVAPHEVHVGGGVIGPFDPTVLPSAPLAAVTGVRRGGLRFGLHVGSFTWPGGSPLLGERVRAVAVAAEAAGFDGVWVMDHLRQIPQVGRDWDPLPDPFTTLAWMAAVTTGLRIGTLVTPVTFRPVGVLAKAFATLDVLSGGRVTAGIGLGWYEREHAAHGLAFPPVAERYRRLDDTITALRALWGPGAPAVTGSVLSVPEAIGYPRPLQDPLPLLVGGSGERTTLPLVGRRADLANLFGTPAEVRRRIGVLRAAAVAAQRDPTAVTVTHLSTALCAPDAVALDALVRAGKPRTVAPDRYAAGVGAGTVAEQVGRYQALADSGVEVAIVRLADLDRGDPAEAIARFAPVVAAFA